MTLHPGTRGLNMQAGDPSERAGLLAALFSFAAGYVDTVGFVSLFGLFTAHVTGNFVLATVVSRKRQRAGAPVRRMLVWTQTIILIAAMAASWAFQPLAQADSDPTMLVGLLVVMAMAVQNCASKVAFAQLPPTTVMTGNVTQFVIDATDVVVDGKAQACAGAIDRLRKFLPPILAFAVGAVGGALVYSELGFMALAGPALALVLASLLLRTSQRTAVQNT